MGRFLLTTLFLCAVVLMSNFGTASAERWLSVPFESTSSKYYMDMDSVARDDSKVFHAVFREDITAEGLEQVKKTYRLYNHEIPEGLDRLAYAVYLLDFKTENMVNYYYRVYYKAYDANDEIISDLSYNFVAPEIKWTPVEGQFSGAEPGMAVMFDTAKKELEKKIENNF